MKEIRLTRGKVALVDDADFDWLNSVKWYAYRKGDSWYAQRTRSRKEKEGPRGVFMHQLLAAVMGFSRPDHKDCDGLNNQRRNLRAATQSEQLCNRRAQSNNTSGFKGVSWHALRRRWRAYIVVGRQQRHLGLFDAAEEAARAYDAAALVLFGDFARPNFTALVFRDKN